MNPTIILILMNRYIRIFRRAGATSPGGAILPAEHGVRTSMVFKKLVRQGIFIPVTAGRYYMDEDAEAKHRKQRQSIVLVLVLLIAAGLVISFFVRR